LRRLLVRRHRRAHLGRDRRFDEYSVAVKDRVDLCTGVESAILAGRLVERFGVGEGVGGGVEAGSA